ncbi:GntR family transcriptional regulator [bacterium AH-315-I18]|nr:GntR family transcriptional regulator [Phycisphaeraceae bacterium]MBN4060935.1 GntR family transcriptional regulator [bacterium AH-315-I18]
MTLEVIKRSEPIYKQIAAHYQDQIAKGILSPGDAIPNTLDLAKQFNVASQTAQNALKELSNRGMIRRVPKLGSFVSEHLHANTMALVCGRSLISESDTRVYSHISFQLSNYLSEQGWNSKVYTPSQPALEGLMIQELERDIRAGLIKSIIVVEMSSQLVPWLKNECTIPWTQAGGNHLKNGQRLSESLYSKMLVEGLDYLKQYGYDRIGLVISTFSMKNVRLIETTLKQLQQQGKDISCIELIHPVDNAPQSGMQATMQRIASGEPMPDAMFVFDDNLTQGVILALLANELTYPQKIGLLTHANKGIELLSPVPLTRFENDSVSLAIENTNNLLRRLRGEEEQPCTLTMKLVPGTSCGE